jgi:hypothetical protein
VDARVAALERTVAALEARLRTLEPEPGLLARLEGASEAGAGAEVGEGEARFGATWLGRVGIVAFITGVALLVIYRFGALGVLVRVALGYALAGALGAGGLWMTRHPRLGGQRLVGQLLVGGGLAVGYFVTYALHFVASFRVVDSEAVALVLLALAIVGVVAAAHRMRSETVAGVSLFLGLHTGMLSEVTAFTLLATAGLAAGAVFFLVKNRWVVVPLSSLVAVYLTHASWAVWPPEGVVRPLSLGLGFLALYFALFTYAALARADGLPPRSQVALPVINWAGATGLAALALEGREGALLRLLLGVSAVHVGLAALAAWRRNAPAVGVFLALALATFAAALPLHLEGAGLTLAWAALGVGAAGASRWREVPALGWVALAALAVALGHEALWEAGPSPLALTAAARAALAAGFVVAERWTRAEPRYAVRGLHAGGAAAAAALLATALLPDALRTLGWAGAAGALFAVGFRLRARDYRLAGFGLLGLAAARLLLVDLSGLTPDQRILTFLASGALLLALSFVYTRRRRSE